ncbi:MAG TPA: hypothetical protein PLV68_06835, partial [Ilumatobacteraceae bacterium]|nr:hypothetical protein [Ilumatobacteraceae bacterium]
MSTPIIIHHANCPDGFGAAWWLTRLVDHNAIIHAATHDDATLPDCTGRDVWIVDFCYQAPLLRELAATA